MPIIRCNCKNEGQDKLHGEGKRVANKTSAQQPTYRCTVCLKEVGASQLVRA